MVVFAHRFWYGSRCHRAPDDEIWGYSSGGRDAKPHYKTFTWIAMNLCSALAAGILIFGMCEWMYYVTGTPFGIEPYSVQVYEYASAYGMFHWGFSAWAFYLVAGVAIGYLYWNKKSAICVSPPYAATSSAVTPKGKKPSAGCWMPSWYFVISWQ